jgi:hypothetical protein
VQGAEFVLGIVAAAGRLAVEGDDRPLDASLGRGLVAEAGDPGVEAGLAIRTRRKTSLPGMPLGRSRIPVRRSSLNLAQRAMAVGPAAPARTARTAMTRMLDRGCRRLMWERGSSRVEKDATISSSLVRLLAIADLRQPGPIHDTVDGIPGRRAGRKPAKLTRSSQKYALALVPDPL